jgi:glycerol uptake facilitator protein
VEEKFHLSQRCLAELLGTALLVLVGPGSVVATLNLDGLLAKKPVAFFSGGDLLGIAFAFGFVIAALVYSIGKVSGCHINPAVTFGLALTKRFPWAELPAYWAAQAVGAVLGALVIWAAFGHSAIVAGMGQTSLHAVGDGGTHLFSTAQGAIAEGVGTALLMFAILGIVDGRSPGDLAGLVIGGVVIAIIMALAPITGASLNPARAFGPELVEALGKGGVTHWGQLVPVYIVPGIVGAGVAAVFYDWIAKPRLIEMPIGEAVTHPDAAAARSGD